MFVNVYMYLTCVCSFVLCKCECVCESDLVFQRIWQPCKNIARMTLKLYKFTLFITNPWSISILS